MEPVSAFRWAALKLLRGVARFADAGLRVSSRLAVALHHRRIVGLVQDRCLWMAVPRSFALAEYLTLATLGDAAAADGCGWSALSDVRASAARGSGEPAGPCGWRTLSELRASVAEGCIELTPDQADKLLRSLRRNGLIRQAGGRERRRYRITGIGVRVLLKIHDRLHAERPEWFDQGRASAVQAASEPPSMEGSSG